MKIAFIQRDAYEKLGVHQLSACLKKAGHTVDLFIERLETDFYKSIQDYNPDFVLYSLYITEEGYMVSAFKKIKELLPSVKTLVGGPFTLIFNEIIKSDAVDYAIRGDGEYSIIDFFETYGKKGGLSKVAGILYLDSDGSIVSNDKFDAIHDLDSLPASDRDIYLKYDYFVNQDTADFIASRGCPYSCTYCYNTEMKNFYDSPFWRTRDPKRVIDEIKELQKKAKFKWIHFQDGTFTANKKWLRAFLELYKNSGLPPFLCNARPENIDAETAKLLKEANCDRITFGIQTGNPDFRASVTGRKMTNEQIINACNLVRSKGIRVCVDIIFGWPGETMDLAMETIRLCSLVKADIVSSNVLVFYPGLRITEKAIAEGFIARTPTLKEISLAHPNTSFLLSSNKRLFINLDKFFYILVKYPRLYPLIRPLLYFPPNFIFYLLKNLHIMRRSFIYDTRYSKLQLIMRYIISAWKNIHRKEMADR